MQHIGRMSPQTCHQWAETFIEEDYDDFVEENRGGKRGDSFFDTFPELEIEMKLYAIEGATRKNASFTSLELAGYLDDLYYELTGEVRRFYSQLFLVCSWVFIFFSLPQVKATDQLIRPERLCRIDLRRYSCKFDKNSQKPYWFGHERPDVIEARNEFVKTFLTNKDHYYLVSDGNDPYWVVPKKTQRFYSVSSMIDSFPLSHFSFLFLCSPRRVLLS